MPKAEDYDFPCSSTFRRHYNSLCDPRNLIDFRVSRDWERHYQLIGVMPRYSPPEGDHLTDPPPIDHRRKRPSDREWFRIGQVLAKAQPRRAGKVGGVLR